MAAEPRLEKQKGRSSGFFRLMIHRVRPRSRDDGATSPARSTPSTTICDTLDIVGAPRHPGKEGEEDVGCPDPSHPVANEGQKMAETPVDNRSQHQQIPPNVADGAQSARSAAPSLTKSDMELWDKAYDGLKETDPDLLDRYEKTLSICLSRSSEHVASSSNRVAQSDPEQRRAQMGVVLEAWLDDDGEAEGTLPEPGPLREVMRRLVSKSPDYSLLWVAACLSIEAAICHSPRTEAPSPGIISLTSKLGWYIGLSKLLAMNTDDSDARTNAAFHKTRIWDDLTGLYQAVLRYQIETVLSWHNAAVERWQPLDLNQLQAEIPRLEGVLITDFSGDNIEAQLRQLLDGGDGGQEAQTEEDEQRTEESEGESQTGRAKSTAGERELESQKDEDESATPESEKPEQEDQAEEDGVTHESQKEEQPTNFLGKLHAPQLEPPPKSSFGNMSDMLYDWAAQTPEYQHWINDNSCQVLWVTGDIGIGKTTLLSAIVRRLQDDPGKNVAYYFPTNRQAWRDPGTKIIKSLVWQVLKEQPDLQKHMKEKLSTIGRDDFEGAGDFYAIATLLCTVLQDSDFKQTWFVFDATEDFYDETDDTSATRWRPRDLMWLIAAASGLSGRAKWLVSSCDASAATDTLRGTFVPHQHAAAKEGDGESNARLTQHCLRIDPESRGVRMAIDQYAASSVSRLSKKAPYPYSSKFQAELAQKLAELSPGSFLWVDMACHAIEMSGFPWHALDILNDLPMDLKALYDRRKEDLTRLYPKDKDYCEAVMSAAAVAFRPLSIAELSDIVDLPPRIDLRVMVNKMCSSFLTVAPDEDTVRFYNRSAGYYMRGKLRQDGNMSKTHSLITQRCLSITLERHCRFNDITKPYAATYWLRHLAKVDAAHLSDVAQQADDFLTSQLVPWLEILTSQGLLEQALDGLRALGKFLDKIPSDNEKSQSLSQHIRMATLAIRFHQASGSPDELSPRNSLLFCPRQHKQDQSRPTDKHLPELTQAPLLPPTDWKPSSCLQVLRGHKNCVRNCAFFFDDRLLATASYDETLRLWDVGTGKAQLSIGGGVCSNWASPLAITASGQLATAGRRTVRLVHTGTGRVEQELNLEDTATGEEDQTHEVRQITFSPSGDRLVAATSRYVITWTIPSFSKTVLADSETAGGEGGREAESNDGNGDQSDQEGKAGFAGFKRAEFSWDGRLLAWVVMGATGSPDTIVVWDVGCQQVKHRLPNPGATTCLNFLRNSTLLALGSDNGVHIWDTNRGGRLRTFGCERPNRVFMLISPDDDQYFATIDSSLVTTWKGITQGGASHLQPRQILRGHGEDVIGMAFSSSGGLLASTSCDQDARIWRLEGNLEAMLPADQVATEDAPPRQNHAMPITFLAFSSDAKIVASGNLGGSIVLWNADDGTQLRSLDDHSREITSLVFSKDDKILISGSIDETIGVWDTKQGKRIHKLEAHDDWVRCVALCPQGRLVASASDDCTVRLWILPPLAQQPGHPDDNHATSQSDAAVELESAVLRGHVDYVYCVAFSPDGRYLASCGDDTRILIWDVENCVSKDNKEQQPPSVLRREGEDDTYRALAFLPGAKRQVSVSDLGSIGLWNTETREHVWGVSREEGWQSHPRVLSIDPDDVLLTEFGAWRNRLTDAPPVSSELPLRHPYSVEERWITWNGQKVVFLPNQYPPSTAGTCSVAVRGGRVAVGCDLGQVLIFKFPEDKKPPLLFQSERTMT